jgi:uroporphyrin-III C-methyltransferase/precorrin-2 dehydrogenase/sirohydrochlorin ferrochelatase
MKSLPILLKDQKILLIGGGNVALQKAQVLSHNEIDFKIISKELNKEILKTTQNIEQKKFKLSDIQDYKIIIDATGNEKVTNKLLKYKKKNPILLNVVDVPKYCDFYFMALTKNRPLQIAVSSNGASPTAAKYFRDECEAMIPKDITVYLKEKQNQRDAGIIEIEKTKDELLLKKAEVYLVGCGLGDVELLTLKAYKVIKSADVVLYDHLISKEIMDIVPSSTKCVYVGKQKGFHSKSQEEINAFIIKYAKKGKCVARLKSGDPFVFGRGAEELYDLLQENIKTQVIPGISSSISAPMMADIPITARGYASSFSVVSAHLRGNSVNLDWIDILKKKNHTVVVLMGLSRVSEIVKAAKDIGVGDNYPCAIISNASRENQEVLQCPLKDLENNSVGVQRPAILVFGDVINLGKELNSLRTN